MSYASLKIKSLETVEDAYHEAHAVLSKAGVKLEGQGVAQRIKVLEKKAKLWDKLIKNCDIQHTDDADGMPIFTVRVGCDWRVKSFKEAVQKSQEGLV